MAQPTVVSSNPASSASDVFLNVPLYVTFAAPGLDEDSININSCMLVNVATEASVSVSLSYNSSTRVLTITPLGTLAEETVYKIRFPGTDIAISSSYVIAEEGTSTYLASTIDITFTTGTRIYYDDTIVAKDAGDLTLEGDLQLPSNVKALGPFSVVTAVPKNHSADVGLTLDGSNRIQVKFNKPISGAIMEQDWLSVDAYPMLDSTLYLASGQVFGTGVIPTMTGLSYSGQYIYANFDGPMPNNAAVSVRVSEHVTATDGTEMGFNDFSYTITTDRFPKVAGPHVMKTELAAAADELNDEYIASLLLKNTIRVIVRWSAFDMVYPQWIAYKYIVNRTILDILDDKDLEKALVAGTRKQLGDFSVSVDNVIGALTLKAKRAEEEAELADDGMMGIKKLGARIEETIAVNYRPDRQWHGVSNRIVDARFKRYQPNIPAANAGIARQANNPNWWFI
jgi:hypothetical protein